MNVQMENNKNSQLIIDVQKALVLIMDPTTDPISRKNAYQYCENFKETSNECAQCGIIMAHKINNHIIRHFGLQLLEHCVKFRWNTISIEEKGYIKDNALLLISEGTLDILVEQKHIKDALSRIVVEIAKREWPQQWESMINEFDAICKYGPTQTELILMVFLRLSEDILIFQKAPIQRRKEIQQALTVFLPHLINFFISILQSNYEVYIKNQHLGFISLDHTNIDRSIQIMLATMETICSFVEPLNVLMIFSNNAVLLTILFDLLQESKLRMAAIECLLEIANKKGKLEERQPIIDFYFCIESINKFQIIAMSSEHSSTTEQTYLFLKKLCNVLLICGTQACHLMTNLQNYKVPETFSKFLEIVIYFTLHSSQVLSDICMPLWFLILKNEKVIAETPSLKEFITRLLKSGPRMLAKVGYPSQDNSPSCVYSRLEFDCDEDFLVFFPKYRSDLCDMLKGASSFEPVIVFEIIYHQLFDLLKKPIEFVPNLGSDTPQLFSSSPIFIEWDAVTICFEYCFQQIDLFSANKKQNIIQNDSLNTMDDDLKYQNNVLFIISDKALELYKLIIDYQTLDPLISSCLLTLISSLFPLIKIHPEILSAVLDKIFHYVQFNVAGQTKSTRSKAVKNVRRHACSILIKICKLYPNLLLPGFNQLYNHIKKLSNDPEELSQMEKCTLYELLILISNEQKNFVKQAEFLEEIVKPVHEFWTSQSLTEIFWSTEKFMDFVGLTQSPIDVSADDTCGINRSQIQYCLGFILGILKRTIIPENHNEAVLGGFVSNVPENGTTGQVYNNPAKNVVLALLPNVFSLIRTFHNVYKPEMFNLCNSDFVASFQLGENDKLMLMGVHPPTGNVSSDLARTRHAVDRMQAFISTFPDISYNIIGNAARYLGHEFYSIPNLASTIISNFFSSLKTLPDFKLRNIIHCAIKPLILNSPKEYYESVSIPVINALAPHVYQLLESKWQVTATKLSNMSIEDCEHLEVQELLEEQLLKYLSREYLDLTDAIFRDKKPPINKQEVSLSIMGIKEEVDVQDTNMMDESEATANNAPLNHRAKEECMGDLGQLVLQHNNVFPPLVLVHFVALSWEDSACCFKAVNWSYPILKQLHMQNKIKEEYACHFIQAIINGLKVHGQHETIVFNLLNALLLSYELLLPQFPAVRNIFLTIPGCTDESLKIYESKLNLPILKNTEKKKREYFKNMVDGAIGRNIGQRFKNEINIKNLQAFRYSSHNNKNGSIDQFNNKDMGLCSLFADGS